MIPIICPPVHPNFGCAWKKPNHGDTEGTESDTEIIP